MKRRVLRAKANKRAMRVISAAAALRPRDPLYVLVDSSFARVASEQAAKGPAALSVSSHATKSNNDTHGQYATGVLGGLLADSLDSTVIRLMYTKATADILEKTAPDTLTFLGRQNAQCVDPQCEEQKREGRSIYEAAAAAISGKGQQVPTKSSVKDIATGEGNKAMLPNRASAASVRHVFVATQSHDVRRDLQKAFPRQLATQRNTNRSGETTWQNKRGQTIVAGQTPTSGVDEVGPCSILRATLQPLAFWVELLHDESDAHWKNNKGATPQPTKDSNKGTAAEAVAKAAMTAGAAAHQGPTISAADAAFMRKMGKKVPTNNIGVLSNKVQQRLAVVNEAQAKKKAALLAEKEARLGAKKKAAEQQQQQQQQKKGGAPVVVAANPLAMKKKQMKERLDFTSSSSDAAGSKRKRDDEVEKKGDEKKENTKQKGQQQQMKSSEKLPEKKSKKEETGDKGEKSGEEQKDGEAAGAVKSKHRGGRRGKKPQPKAEEEPQAPEGENDAKKADEEDA